MNTYVHVRICLFQSCRRFLPAQLFTPCKHLWSSCILRFGERCANSKTYKRTEKLNCRETCLHFETLIWTRNKHLYIQNRQLSCVCLAQHNLGAFCAVNVCNYSSNRETYMAAVVAVVACHHISCHMHVHFYVFEQFAANLLYVVCAIAPFGRYSFLPQPCVMFSRAKTHSHRLWAGKRKFRISGCTLSLWMINSGTRWTDPRRVRVCKCVYVRCTHITTNSPNEDLRLVYER